jgi:hypothetical protein
MRILNKRRSKGKTVAIVIGVFVIVGLFLPSEFSVIRVRYIKAKPAAVASYVNDLRQWKTWFPWKRLGKPYDLKLGDVTTGVGAHMNWVNRGGKGNLTIDKSSLEKGIDFKASFYDGLIECQSSLLHTEFKKGKTYVSWAVKGKIDLPIVGGYLALLREPVVGAILNKGLKNLKRNVKRDIRNQAESEPPKEKEARKKPS